MNQGKVFMSLKFFQHIFRSIIQEILRIESTHTERHQKQKKHPWVERTHGSVRESIFHSYSNHFLSRVIHIN